MMKKALSVLLIVLFASVSFADLESDFEDAQTSVQYHQDFLRDYEDDFNEADAWFCDADENIDLQGSGQNEMSGQDLTECIALCDYIADVMYFRSTGFGNLNDEIQEMSNQVAIMEGSVEELETYYWGWYYAPPTLKPGWELAFYSEYNNVFVPAHEASIFQTGYIGESFGDFVEYSDMLVSDWQSYYAGDWHPDWREEDIDTWQSVSGNSY